MEVQRIPGKSGHNSSKVATASETAQHAASVRSSVDARRNPAWATMAYRDGLPSALMLQTKLTVSEPGGMYEQEADRLSEQVMRMPEPQLQHNCACGGKCPKCQSEQPDPEQERVQTKRVQPSDTGEVVAPPIVHGVLRSPGQPLDPATRAFMEPRFGHDFSQVRVHTGPTAEQSAQDVNAQAYTVGQDIVFGRGRFAPEMQEGRQLLAHELTHVVQQSGADGMSVGQSDEKRDLSPTSQSITIPREPRALARPGRQAGLGNHQISRRAQTLSRKSDTVTVYLRELPPVHAADLATPENRQLAERIDELDKLKDADLAKRREEAAFGAVRKGDNQQESLQMLEAIEFLARRRGLDPLKGDYYFYKRGWVPSDSRRRLNVRVLIEEGVRETGSFKKALNGFIHTSEIESDIEFFQAEADSFAKEFTSQAQRTAERILGGSLSAIRDVLSSYGLSFDSAVLAAQRLTRGARGSDIDSEAENVVRMSAKSNDVDAPDRVGHRFRLAQWVKYLKQLQQRVEERGRKLTRDASDKSIAEYNAEVHELRSAWIEAERHHPILAAYRGDGDLGKIDLGTLGTDPVELQMKAVLTQLLPKIVNIGKAQQLVKSKRSFALTLPSVVALTRANMFIPGGSIRAGVANDLVTAAREDEDPLLVKVVAWAVTIVLLIPSAGESLAIPAGMAAAGLAAYSAAKEWDKYETQKILINTDIDLAHSLSTEEPSLAGFVASLVSLGFEGGLLFTTFNKARKLKALVSAGEDTLAAAAVDELNVIGKQHGADDLGKRALREISTEMEAGTAAGSGTAKVIEEETIKKNKLVEYTFEHEGHTWDILKDGRIVRCSLCTFHSLEEAFGDLTQRYPRLREAMTDLKKLKGKAATDLATDLAQQMDQIDKAERMSLHDLKKLLGTKKFPKGTPLGNDLRYIRYLKEGGKDGFEKWERSAYQVWENAAKGTRTEEELIEAYILGPKNTRPMINPVKEEDNFIPDFIEGNPTKIKWGEPYHFKEIKNWADMSDTGNLSAMLKYVDPAISKISGSRLTIYYKSNTYMSGPLREQIEGLSKKGIVELIPYVGK